MLAISLIINKNIQESDLSIICDNKNINLIGIIDKNYIVSEEIIKKYDLKRYSDTNYVISCSDAFFYTSADDQDYDTIIHLIKQSKHIFFYENPHLNTQKLKHITKTAEEANTTIQLYHSGLYNTAYQASKQYIFKPLFIEYSHKEKYDEEYGTSSDIYNHLIYGISLVKGIVRGEIKKLKTNIISILQDKNDFIYVLIEFDNGCFANITINQLSFNKEKWLSIHQSGGTIDINLVENIASMLQKTKTNEPEALKAKKQKIKNGNKLPLEYKLKEFYNSIHNNFPSIFDIEEYINTVELIPNIKT